MIDELRADEPWDCVVVGGGAAGLSAALVLGRARRRTLVVDAGQQSNRAAEGIGGLLGHDRRAPEELYHIGREELTSYPTVRFEATRVVAARDDGTTFEGCPFCHGWEVRDRPLGVLDRSERAVERALLLRFWSDDVTLYANGPLDDDEAARGRLQRAGVDLDERVVAGLRGPGRRLEAISFIDGSERACEALLVVAPLRQRSSLATDLGADVADPASSSGPLAVDPMGRTSVPRVYAAGDVGADVPPSVATAIAAGSTAAKGVVHDLVATVNP